METHLSVYDGKQRVRIPIAQIEYLSGVGNYSNVHIAGQPCILLSTTLRKLGERLPGFLRIHKRTLVNPRHVAGHNIERYGDEALIFLSNDRSLTVSRRRASLIRKQLLK